MRRGWLRIPSGLTALALILSTGTSPAATADAPFTPRAFFWEGRSIRDDATTRSLPFVVGAADMTGDGICDLVLATAYAVRIYAGDGISGFRRAQHLEIGGREGFKDPWPSLHVSAGVLVDIDGDGDLDVLLMLQEWSPTATAYAAYAVRNDRGKLTKWARTEMNAECRALAPCLAANSGSTFMLCVRPQWGTRWRDGVALARVNQDGTLALLSERWLLDEEWELDRLADATGDGVPDAIITHRDVGVDVIAVGADGGPLGRRHVADIGMLQASTTADLNHDQVTDILLSTSNGFAVVFGLGGGSFSEPMLYETGYDGGPLALADYDGDAVRELLLTSDNGQQIFVFDATAEGAFGPQIGSLVPTEPIAWWGEPVQVANLDGDSLPDTVLISRHGVIPLFSGKPAHGATQVMFAGLKVLGTGDADGDGDPDVLAQGAVGLEVLRNGSGSLGMVPGTLGELAGVDVRAVRIRDERVYVLADALGAPEGEAPTSSLYILDTTGAALNRVDLGSGAAPVLAVGDLDADGVPDVAGTREGRLWIAWGGAAAAEHTLSGSASLLGTLEGRDGPSEELVAVVTDDYAAFIPITFIERVPVEGEPLLRTVSVPIVMTAGDIDGDGTLDLAAIAVTLDGSVTETGGAELSIVGAEACVVLAAGTVSATALPSYPAGHMPWPWSGLAVADVTGDGVADFIYSTTAAEGIWVHPGDRTGTFGTPTVIEKGIGPLYASDIDGNGVTDLVGSTLGMSPVIWVQWNGGAR